MCLELEGRQENNSFLADDQRAVIYTASSSWSYCPFAATFEAMEASYFRREKVLEYPGWRDLMDDNKLVPEEFVV
jgi:hypothetical protein